MGNSICCFSFDKKEAILQKDLMLDLENSHDKKVKDYSYSNKCLTKDIYFKKSHTNQSPKTGEYEDFENPLPNIVIIKRKKNFK